VHVRVCMHVRQAENQRLAKEVATLQHLHHPSQQQSNRSAHLCLSHTYLSIHICVHTMFQGAYMCIYIARVYIPATEQYDGALLLVSRVFEYTYMSTSMLKYAYICMYIVYVYILATEKSVHIQYTIYVYI